MNYKERLESGEPVYRETTRFKHFIVNGIKVRTSLSLFDELQFYLHQLALSYSFLNSL